MCAPLVEHVRLFNALGGGTLARFLTTCLVVPPAVDSRGGCRLLPGCVDGLVGHLGRAVESRLCVFCPVLVIVAAYPPNRDCTKLTACSMLWIVLLPLCKPLSSLASRFANSTAGSEKQDHVLATYLLHETSFIPLSHTITDRFPIELSTAMPPLRVQTADRLAVRCHLLSYPPSQNRGRQDALDTYPQRTHVPGWQVPWPGLPLTALDVYLDLRPPPHRRLLLFRRLHNMTEQPTYYHCLWTFLVCAIPSSTSGSPTSRMAGASHTYPRPHG